MTSPTVHQLFDLTGKTALLTGGSGYLGGAFAAALAEAGANVVIASRERERALECAAALPLREGQRHHAVALDQLDEASIQSGFAEAVQASGAVDILINNGHAGHTADWTSADAASFNATLANAAGWFLLARCLRDHVVARGAAGSIVMIGSMYGQVGSYPDAYAGLAPASPAAYHTLKGGIIHLTRHLAVYWAADQVRVNCLSPGPFPSPQVNPEMVSRLRQKSPMGRMGLPHELKGALVLLASAAGSYITGQNLTVDGGWTAW